MLYTYDLSLFAHLGKHLGDILVVWFKRRKTPRCDDIMITSMKEDKGDWEGRIHQEGEWKHPHQQEHHHNRHCDRTHHLHLWPKDIDQKQTSLSHFSRSFLFTSEFDILLPSYVKSANKIVNLLYRTSPETYSYLEYIERFAHPTFHCSCRWICW